MTKAKDMSNAIARKYFLHDIDTGLDGKIVCYFAENGYDGGWGFWVDDSGEWIVDSVHPSTGEMPSSKIIDACVRAAKKHLNRKPKYEY